MTFRNDLSTGLGQDFEKQPQGVADEESIFSSASRKNCAYLAYAQAPDMVQVQNLRLFTQGLVF